MRAIRLVVLALLVGGCATAGGGGNVPNADVSGTWTGAFTASNVGQIGLTLTLQQVGSNVTGNVSGRAAYAGPIQGTVSGDQFSWKLLSGPGAGDLVVKGNEMSGRARFQYGEGQMTFRRAP